MHPQTLLEKIWNRHVVTTSAEGEALVYVDRNFVHEEPFLAIGARTHVMSPVMMAAAAVSGCITDVREPGACKVTSFVYRVAPPATARRVK